MRVADTLVFLSTLYGAAGLVVAIVFLIVGVGRIDESARGVYAFRPLLIPGIMLLWPLVLWRWSQLERTPAVPEGGSGER